MDVVIRTIHTPTGITEIVQSDRVVTPEEAMTNKERLYKLMARFLIEKYTTVIDHNVKTEGE